MSWLQFVEGKPKPKTKTWAVRSLTGASLGEVAWFARWRCYALFPDLGAVFEKDCLREIADFCQARTAEQREQYRATRRAGMA